MEIRHSRPDRPAAACACARRLTSRVPLSPLVLLSLLAATAAGSLATSAGAHEDDHHRLQGGQASLSSSASTPARNRFTFKTKHQVAIYPAAVVDPTLKVSSLIVRTVGDEEHSTHAIRLDPLGWRPQGEDASRGWTYRARRGEAAGGVYSIKLKYTRLGGQLQIKAGGEDWPLPLPSPVESLELMLTVDGHVYCAEFSEGTGADFRRNRAGSLRAADADPPTVCAPACGNAVLELGEACDDGNAIDDDTCSNACVACTPGDDGLEGTFAALQSVVFENPAYVCTTPICHGSEMSGGLDLRGDAAWDALVGVPSEIAPDIARVFAGDDDASLLYMKLAAKTLGSPAPSEVPGVTMPLGLAGIAPEHLEALRLWIRGGAPREGVVGGTSELLAACLPPPDPLKAIPPAVPPADEGLQFTMPPWPLPSQTENQICVATYYDVSAPGLVPEEELVDCAGVFPGTNDTGTNAGKCFSWGRQLAIQDAQSHHMQLYIYQGDYDAEDPGWGSWTCKEGENAGAACEPGDTEFCGSGICSGDIVTLGNCFPPFYGPPDLFIGFSSAPLFLATQEPVLSQVVPAGGYGLLPLKGVIIWNSHAFNFTDQDSTMQAWLNEYFAAELEARADIFFEGDYIYTQDVPPFETREYCATRTFPEGFRFYELLSHVHKRGARFRIYDAPQTPCPSGGPAPNGIGPATSPSCLPGSEDDKIYESFSYDDPIHLHYDPPRVLTGSVAERTLKYCALYDNGATDPSTVKRASTSPPLPSPGIPGGPCPPEERKCLGGPNQAALCFGDDANCPDSVCDACNLRGGVTSDDEMFILVGYSLE